MEVSPFGRQLLTRNRTYRAIRNPILVLSGTKIRLTVCSERTIRRF
jgi:hypothetical protein